ncbi:MAG: hypothetical protein WCJ75_10245, partial [Desulfomonile sp.]
MRRFALTLLVVGMVMMLASFAMGRGGFAWAPYASWGGWASSSGSSSGWFGSSSSSGYWPASSSSSGVAV